MSQQYESRSAPPRKEAQSASASDAKARDRVLVDFGEAMEGKEAFLARLSRMSAEERRRAARFGGFTRLERSLWAARFPDEVPLINGEYEWIALSLAELD
jgi:hypothetical protein